MDWWQLTDFDNPDNKFRIVRNLYNVVYFPIFYYFH